MMISKPLSQIIEIPDPSLSEILIPVNDNHEPTALSRENLEAGSILAPREEVRLGKGPLLIVATFFLFGAALVAAVVY
jgi:hypothetical protein